MTDDGKDEHTWLEEIEGDTALDWVKQRNADAIKALGDPTTTPAYERILGILDSKDKIPGISRISNDGYYYNFWRDDKHVAGIWRRVTLESYRTAAPEWQTVIDVDALPAYKDGGSWVWHGTSMLDEGEDGPWDRVLVFLSPGGSDADTMREFDLPTLSFVDPKDGGFALPDPTKNSIDYRARNELLIGSDFGEGSLTSSGYPRVIKSWKRGTPLSEATTVFEGEHEDVSVSQYAYHDRGFIHEFQHRQITFYTSKRWYRRPSSLQTTADAETTPFREVPIPDDASIGTFGDGATIKLRSDWEPEGAGRTFKAGSLLATTMDKVMDADFTSLKVLFEPDAHTSLQGTASTRNYKVLELLCDVKCSLRVWRYEGGGAWTDTTAATPAAAVGEEVSVAAVWPDSSDELWVWRSGFLSPDSLELGGASDSCAKTELLKTKPHMFDASGLLCEQNFADSEDGTKVPYFVIRPKDLPFDGSSATLLDGYGGFEVSMTPYYSAGVGAAWLERGGVKVIANIRGGGEYGPAWHQAALKANRHKAYEDFEAVARDLIQRRITSPPKLACIGGSNGGLLVGNMITRRGAALFGAVVCQVPLLDMKRYAGLLAGASWMAEYGDPSKPEEWASLRGFSAYHRLKHDCLGQPEPAPPEGASVAKVEGWECPRVLFTTSTKDDRVHPGHARKMVKVLHDDARTAGKVLYWENIEGGHGGAADNKQRAYMWALSYNFLAQTFGMKS
jgi:prolyl oligopeptidase